MFLSNEELSEYYFMGQATFLWFYSKDFWLHVRYRLLHIFAWSWQTDSRSDPRESRAGGQHHPLTSPKATFTWVFKQMKMKAHEPHRWDEAETPGQIHVHRVKCHHRLGGGCVIWALVCISLTYWSWCVIADNRKDRVMCFSSDPDSFPINTFMSKLVGTAVTLAVCKLNNKLSSFNNLCWF